MDIKDILLLGGTNFNNENFRRCQQNISRDKDIKLLIFLGRKPFYEVIVLFILFLVNGVRIYFGHRGLSFYLILLVYFLYLVIINWRKINNFRRYLFYFLSGSSPSNPLDIWDPIATSISDGQVLLPAERLSSDKQKVSMIYTGEPYYQLKYIDSLTLSWNHTKLNYIIHLRHLLKFFLDFAVKTVAGYSEEKIFC